MSSPVSDEIRRQYEALTSGAGLADLGARTQLEIGGADAAKFLHNFCTADINRLNPGEGCEAFITTGQGKTLGYVYVFRASDSLLLDTSQGQAEALQTHLDRYVIREDATFTDHTEQSAELLLAGASAAALLGGLVELPPPVKLLAHVNTRLAAVGVSIRRVDFVQPAAFFLGCNRSDRERLEDELCAAGAVQCGPDAVDIARIEAGALLFGRDISAENLPQEAGRDAQAISLTKGCYLGQETVARIDALGHVNWLLVGLKFSGGAAPDVGTEATDGGKVVARITSSCWSPRLGAPFALAYVRYGRHERGSEIAFPDDRAEVVNLPLD